MKVTKSGDSPFFEEFLSKLAIFGEPDPVGDPQEAAPPPVPEQVDITTHPPESEAHLDMDSRIKHALDQIDRALALVGPDGVVLIHNPATDEEMGLNLKGLRDVLIEFEGPSQEPQSEVEPEIKTPW